MTSLPPNGLLRAELKRAKELNAELVKALELAADELKMARYFNAEKMARAVIAKAKAQP